MPLLLSVGLMLALIAVYGYFIHNHNRYLWGQSARFSYSMFVAAGLFALVAVPLSLFFQFTEGAEVGGGILLLGAVALVVRRVLDGNRRWRERTYAEVDDRAA